MGQYNQDEVEIDIKELLFVLLRKFWIIFAAGILCGVGAGAFSYYAIDPIYTSSTKIYIINRQNSEYTSYSDLQTSTQLTMDYKILILSRPVTEQVIRDLNLDMTHSDLIDNIKVTAPEDTRILQIEVENTDPILAKQLADSVAEVSAKRMVSVMEMEKVNVVEPGNLPQEPSSPSIIKNTVIGGMAGGFIASFLILLFFFLDDTIKSPEEVEKYLGLTTLGNLPLEVKHRFSRKWKRKKKEKVKVKKATNKNRKKKSSRKIKVNRTSREKAERLRIRTAKIVDQNAPETNNVIEANNTPETNNVAETNNVTETKNDVQANNPMERDNDTGADQGKADLELSVMIDNKIRMNRNETKDSVAVVIESEKKLDDSDWEAKKAADAAGVVEKKVDSSEIEEKAINFTNPLENANNQVKRKMAGEEKPNNNLNFASNEAYKTLRTNIQFCGKDVKTICVTSCLPNEGKTAVSFQLARTIAESGKKVLFIDADLRKSVIISRLKIEKASYGLSQYLSGMNELDEVINKTSVPNVDIIFTGPIPPNPSEMLGSDTFKELIKAQREIYDYIIIDTPPLGIVIDSANVAQVCDGTLLVIEVNNISYKLAQKVLSQLEKGRCRVLGAVLNKIEGNRKGYYGKAYGKYYGKYYGEYEIEK